MMLLMLLRCSVDIKQAVSDTFRGDTACFMSGNGFRISERSGKEAEQDAGSNGRANDSGNVRPHGMHEQIVGGVVFQAEVV